MNCGWVQDRLLLYLNDELGPSASARFGVHLEQCGTCAAALEELAESQDSLRESIYTTVQPPASLDARILKRIQALPRRRSLWTAPTLPWNAKAAFAFACCTLVMVMAGYLLGRWSAASNPRGRAPEAVATRPTLNLAALADTHRAWNGSAGSGNVDAEAVAASLTRQTGLHITPLDRTDRALRLTDSAVVQMNHIPVAMRHYDWNGIPISLAQTDGVRLDMPYSLRELRHHGNCYLIHQSEGLTFVFWCEGTDNFVLVSRVPPSQLFALACKICTKLRHG